MRYLPALAFLLLLAACSARPHPLGYYELIKVDDSLKAVNQQLMADLKEKEKKIIDLLGTTPLPAGQPLLPKKVLNIISAVYDMDHYLANVKTDIFDHIDGNLASQASMMALKDMLHPANTSTTTRYFIGENPDEPDGKAKEIKEKLVQFRDLLETYSGSKLSSKAGTGLSTGDEVTPWDGREKSWEVSRFYKVNAAEAYVEITKLQLASWRAAGELVKGAGY